MAFIETPNAAELTLVFGDSAGNDWTNGLDFTKATTWAEEDLNALCLAAADAFEELMLGIMTPAVFLKSVKGRDLSTEFGASAETVLTPPLQGTRTGSPTPASACMTVTKKSGIIGRSFRGRVYWSGLASGDLLNTHTWGSSAADEVTDAWTAYIAAIVGEVAGSAAVIISTQQGGVTLSEGDPTPVTAWVGRQPTATLRGRSGNGI